jgi:energy-coupling factor transporter ATP-binding protein EcfA2
MAATSLSTILSRMQDMDLQTVEKKLFSLLYGPFGAGKTTLAMGLAQRLRASFGGRILYLDSSDGWVSLDNIPSLKDGATRYELGDSKDLATIGEALRKRSKGFEDFTVLVIDEASSIATDVLENVVRDRTGTDRNVELPEVEGKDYGTMTQILGATLRNLKKVPNLHVIVLAHSRDKQDHRKVTITFPAFSPMMLTEIQKISHLTGYVTAEMKGTAANTEYIRQVQSQPTMLISAKSRIGHMPVKTDFPTFVSIVGDWVDGDSFEADVDGPEPQVEIEADELPEEGVPVADVEDDEPVLVEDN